MLSPSSSEPILELKGLCKAFGQLRAVDDVDFTVARGSLTGLIGPNGAGKTTTFDLIAGAQRRDSGRILFQGQAIDALSPHAIFRRGLARTFQVPRPLPT